MTMVRVLWGMMALLVLAGLLILSMWGVPAPSTPIEKTIPHDKIVS